MKNNIKTQRERAKRVRLYCYTGRIMCAAAFQHSRIHMLQLLRVLISRENLHAAATENRIFVFDRQRRKKKHESKRFILGMCVCLIFELVQIATKCI